MAYDGRIRYPRRDMERERAASANGEVKTWHMSPDEMDDYFDRIADKRPRDIEGKKITPPLQQNERRMSDMGKQKQGPDKQAFLKLIAAGKSIAKAEQDLGLKPNGMYYWLGKWGLTGITPDKASEILNCDPDDQIRNCDEPVMRSTSKEAQAVEDKVTEAKGVKADTEGLSKWLYKSLEDKSVEYDRLLLLNTELKDKNSQLIEDRDNWRNTAEELKASMAGAAVIANQSGARMRELEQAILKLEEEREMLLATFEKASDMELQLADASHADNVHSPAHYTQGGIETIEFIRAKLTHEEYLGYCKGSALESIAEDGDLRKAGLYLGWAVNE